jgi:hypothetical protein
LALSAILCAMMVSQFTINRLLPHYQGVGPGVGPPRSRARRSGIDSHVRGSGPYQRNGRDTGPQPKAPAARALVPASVVWPRLARGCRHRRGGPVPCHGLGGRNTGRTWRDVGRFGGLSATGPRFGVWLLAPHVGRRTGGRAR